MIRMAVLAVGAGAMMFATGAQAQSHSQCQAHAQSYAQNYSSGREVVGGAIVGGLGGAVIGGIVGGGRGAGIGAGVGAATGAVGGAAVHANRYQDAYDWAYRDCMSRVAAPVRSTAPAPWTNEWHSYCSAKFRSFNRNTGMYRTYSGEYRLCE